MLVLMRHLVLLFVVPALCAAAKVPSRPTAAVNWHTNYVTAQAQALSEGKLMLVHFSGSDWCGWCMKLRKDVFQQKEFMDYARTNLVLLSVDFPKRTPQPRRIQETNEALKARFQVEGIPTLLVVKSDGTKLGVLGFGEGGPKTFIRELEKFVIQRTAALNATGDAADARKTGNPAAPSGSPTMAAFAASPSAPTPTFIPVSRPVPKSSLQLKSIVENKGHRQAQINDQTLLAGQTARVRVASGEISIRCVEIRDSSVIVRVEGRKEPVELKLAHQL